jgi:hypothetical protein
MEALRPKHVEDYDTIKCLWKWKCVRLVTLLWYLDTLQLWLMPQLQNIPTFIFQQQWGIQDCFFMGGRGSTNSVEARRQRERGSGGGSHLVRGSTQFANKWNPYSDYVVTDVYSTELGIRFSFVKISEFRGGGGLNPPTPNPPGVRHCPASRKSRPLPLWGSSVSEHSVARTLDRACVWKWPTTDAVAPRGPLTLRPVGIDMSKPGYSSHHCHVTSLT